MKRYQAATKPDRMNPRAAFWRPQVLVSEKTKLRPSPPSGFVSAEIILGRRVMIPPYFTVAALSRMADLDRETSRSNYFKIYDLILKNCCKARSSNSMRRGSSSIPRLHRLLRYYLLFLMRPKHLANSCNFCARVLAFFSNQACANLFFLPKLGIEGELMASGVVRVSDWWCRRKRDIILSKLRHSRFRLTVWWH